MTVEAQSKILQCLPVSIPYDATLPHMIFKAPDGVHGIRLGHESRAGKFLSRCLQFSLVDLASAITRLQKNTKMQGLKMNK